MLAVIVERNKLVGRKVARLLAAVGWQTTVVEEPGQATDALATAELVCGDAFDGDFLAEHARRGVRTLLWTAEPLKRSMRYLVDAAIDHVLARKDFESPPRAWEVTLVGKRLLDGEAAPLAAFVDYAHTAAELDIAGTRDRDRAVVAIGEVIGRLGVPKRVVDMFGELAHELLMNAIYDAPVDAAGHALYAADRKADVALAAHERPRVAFATDGSRVVLRVRDPFGRLERRHVVDGLARGLASGEIDREGGGAGLGMMVCHNSSSAMVFDVVRGKSTEVTAMYDLDQNLRDLRTQAKSLHIWSR